MTEMKLMKLLLLRFHFMHFAHLKVIGEFFPFNDVLLFENSFNNGLYYMVKNRCYPSCISESNTYFQEKLKHFFRSKLEYWKNAYLNSYAIT